MTIRSSRFGDGESRGKFGKRSGREKSFTSLSGKTQRERVREYQRENPGKSEKEARRTITNLSNLGFAYRPVQWLRELGILTLPPETPEQLPGNPPPVSGPGPGGLPPDVLNVVREGMESGAIPIPGPGETENITVTVTPVSGQSVEELREEVFRRVEEVANAESGEGWQNVEFDEQQLMSRLENASPEDLEIIAGMTKGQMMEELRNAGRLANEYHTTDPKIVGIGALFFYH